MCVFEYERERERERESYSTLKSQILDFHGKKRFFALKFRWLFVDNFNPDFVNGCMCIPNKKYTCVCMCVRERERGVCEKIIVSKRMRILYRLEQDCH